MGFNQVHQEYDRDLDSHPHSGWPLREISLISIRISGPTAKTHSVRPAAALMLSAPLLCTCRRIHRWVIVTEHM